MLDAVRPRFRVSICAVAYELSMPRIVKKKEQPRLCGLAEAIPPMIGLLSTVKKL
jgi:hypothetical protein